MAALDEHLANVICNLEGTLAGQRSPQGSSGLSGLTLAFFQYILATRKNNIERTNTYGVMDGVRRVCTMYSVFRTGICSTILISAMANYIFCTQCAVAGMHIVFLFDKAIPNHTLLSRTGAAPQTDTRRLGSRHATHQIDNVLTTDLTCRACYVSLHTYCTSFTVKGTGEHP